MRLEDRLDNVAGSTADRHLHRVVARLAKQAERRQLLLDERARVHASDAGKLARIGVERAVVVEDVDALEPVPLADLVVVEVVRQRDLDRARAKLHVDGDRVAHDRDPSALDERVHR